MWLADVAVVDERGEFSHPWIIGPYFFALEVECTSDVECVDTPTTDF